MTWVATLLRLTMLDTIRSSGRETPTGHCHSHCFRVCQGSYYQRLSIHALVFRNPCSSNDRLMLLRTGLRHLSSRPEGGGKIRRRGIQGRRKKINKYMYIYTHIYKKSRLHGSIVGWIGVHIAQTTQNGIAVVSTSYFSF